MGSKVSVTQVIGQAFAAAKEAEAEFRAQYGEPMHCGFAWVNVSPGNSAIARLLKSEYNARSSYYKGVDVWNPGKSMSQSMSLKEAGAEAFAKVLRDAGYKAYAMSRAD